MKRGIACLMAVILTFGTISQAYASQESVVAGDATAQAGTEQTGDSEAAGTEAQSTSEEPEETASESSAPAEGAEETGIATGSTEAGRISGTESTGTGQVNVSIGAALILEQDVPFTVTLLGPGGYGKSEVITLHEYEDGQKRIEGGTSFTELANGNYRLRVSAPGFATYTQQITVNGQGVGVSLMTGFLQGIVYEAGSAHPGVLLIGDVNGDGVVDGADRESLAKAIDSDDLRDGMDLNGDDKVNLIDLELFAKGYLVTADTMAMLEKFVPASLITPAVGSGTRIRQGELKDLLENDGSVTLAPENGAAISGSNPVTVEFDFGSTATMDGIEITSGENTVFTQAELTIVYEDVDGKEQTQTVGVKSGVHALLLGEMKGEIDEHGNIQINLGGRVAVKKVTLKITGVGGGNNLAEISKVEFINGMENRIPEPQMDIPQQVAVEPGSKEFTVSWSSCVNVTGYEVAVTVGDKTEYHMTAGTRMTVTLFGGKELANGTEYRVKVQSLNGTWRSGYGAELVVVPKSAGKPDKPDNVKAVGGYKSITVSWKQMKDTDFYNLYYRERGAASYQKIEGITTNSYTLMQLRDITEYQIYVTGVNAYGESPASLECIAKTVDMNPAVMPKYRLINTGAEGEKGAHIVSATQKGQMVDSPLDTAAGTAWGTVDKKASSYYSRSTWDDGGFNNLGEVGLIYEFDDVYQIDTIAVEALVPSDMQYSYAKVRWWDEAGTASDQIVATVLKKQDAEGRTYFMIKLPAPVEAKKLQIGLARYLANTNLITVSEVYFYYYDSLADDIAALYADDLHTMLKENVTQADIDALRERINTQDPVSGEYHPDRELLLRELKTAEEILANTVLSSPVIIYNTITTSDVSRGFGGLNAWQPLGVTAAAGEEITVYVGHNSKKTGENTNLQLVVTQYHAESSPFYQVVANLKVGSNTVTIPKVWTTGGVESGGALYVQYTGSQPGDRYAVRVSGGVQVPVLDLYQVTDDGERLSRTVAYVEALDAYVGRMENVHNEVHKDSGNREVDYAYDEKNCILGASDILLDTMMLSLPAAQILSGAGNGSTGERAQRILSSMEAMEDMMYLFYQHKGLNAGAPDAKDQLPKMHLNIRYQRMFSGAFMYASGNHIGIEWDQTSGMMTAVPVQSDAQGKYISGQYFGWGIAHEIGHCINQSAYEVAEITNNYYAQLAQAKDKNEGMRFAYDNVYQKVTSGTKGASPNIATQLAMYWQLHLAYDTGYNYKTYDNYDEQLKNLFFARMDTYARDTTRAPRGAEAGVALHLSGDKDQDLMRLACAAAERDLLTFFERWGMTPDAGTRAYAGQFEEETRAIYYVSDDSRAYTLTHAGTGVLGTEGSVVALGDGTTAVTSASVPNQVNLTMDPINISHQEILGYEIVRCVVSGGQVERQTVGFATGETFTDTVAAMNNRVVFYEITLIDQYLNRSAVRTLAPLKIGHDGSLDKTFWTAETTGLTPTELVAGKADTDAPCDPIPENPVIRTLDNDTGTVYRATVDSQAEIVLQFHQSLVVTGLKYTAEMEVPSGQYEVYVWTQTNAWEQVAEGRFGSGGTEIIYFANKDKAYTSTYATTAVKLVFGKLDENEISIAELDVLGVTGDDVEFVSVDGVPAIGRLGADYQYGTESFDVIPEGSIVFTGAYKGNPAYNVLILYDGNGAIVGGQAADGSLLAEQIILADIPEKGNITDTADGRWIYWIAPENQGDFTAPAQVRAELYRVNDAQTNAGQRLVSDSLLVDVPASLPTISFSGREN